MGETQRVRETGKVFPSLSPFLSLLLMHLCMCVCECMCVHRTHIIYTDTNHINVGLTLI